MFDTQDYLIMEEEGCLEKDIFNWVWDEDGEWGWLVPKTRSHMVADISIYSNKAGLHSNNTLDHQMFKFDGKLLISKAHPNYTVTPTADGKLEVKPIEEGSDTQMWTLEKGMINHEMSQSEMKFPGLSFQLLTLLQICCRPQANLL